MRSGWDNTAIPPQGQDSLQWLLPPRWSSPTFGEFLERVEHEFGSAADLNGLLLLGLGREEHLAPTDIEVLCGQLGVPPEDFGVGPFL